MGRLEKKGNSRMSLEKVDWAIISFSVLSLIIGVVLLAFGFQALVAGALIGVFFTGIPSVLYTASERAGHKARQEEILREFDRTNRELVEAREQIARLQEQLGAKVREAIKLGHNQVAISGSGGIPADNLDVKQYYDDIKSVNDIQRLLNALRGRWGDSVADAFLLGRRLGILSSLGMAGGVDQRTFSEMGHTLSMLGTKKSVVDAFDAFWPRFMQSSDANGRLFFLALYDYLTTLRAQPRLERFLTSTEKAEFDQLRGLYDEATGESKRTAIVSELFACLKSAGVKDPDVDLFLGVHADDADLMKRAIAAGADTSITDSELISKYRQILTRHCPDALRRLDQFQAEVAG